MTAFVRPGAGKFTAPGQLAAERALRAAAVERGAHTVTDAVVTLALARFAESGVELGHDQAVALRGIATSGAKVEVLAAPAGTGKSFVVGALAEVWRGQGHRVIGLAPSQVAADRLAEEGVDSVNIDRWLRAQRRPERPGEDDEDEPLRLRPGTLVVVDEAGMASTQQLLQILQRIEAAGGKLLLTGDPMQLGAIGPGGSLADLSDRAITYELVEVRRFSAEWEREASLRLRLGDATVLDEYARHGRILDGGTVEQAQVSAQRAWLADILDGKDSLLLVGSNEDAAKVNGALRAALVELGQLGDGLVELPREGTVAGIGDIVQARRNGWEHLGQDGNQQAPINRSAYRVLEVRGDGAVVVTAVGADGGQRITLTPQYVAENLTLAYASTVHAAQGRTVDTAHGVIGVDTPLSSLYVALTRGRDGNTAHVVTIPVAADLPTGATLEVEARSGRAVMADAMAKANADLSAQQQIVDAADEARSTTRNAGELIEGVAITTGGRTSVALDEIVARGQLAETHRRALAADDGMSAVEHLLRSAELAGHNRAELLADAVEGRSFDGARSTAQVLYHRIRAKVEATLAPPQLNSFADLIPADVPDRVRPWLEARADRADDRRRELGERVADAPPPWALNALGEPPADPLRRLEWERKAGWAAAAREMGGHDDDVDALGIAPPAGLSERWAIWRTAHTALDLPDAGADEREMTDGQLRNRVAAYERERRWAPRWVDDELGAAHEAAAAAHANATIWAARAAAEQRATEAAQLREAAAAEASRAEAAVQVAERLTTTDRARSAWFRHTAATLEFATRARAELRMRGVEVERERDATTADHWLAEQRRAAAEEDAWRDVGEHDIADAEADEAPARDSGPVLETGRADIRSTARIDHDEWLVRRDAEQQQRIADGWYSRDDKVAEKAVYASVAREMARTRVPTVDEAEQQVARAMEALQEIELREQADRDREAEETYRAQLAGARANSGGADDADDTADAGSSSGTVMTGG